MQPMEPRQRRFSKALLLPVLLVLLLHSCLCLALFKLSLRPWKIGRSSAGENLGRQGTGAKTARACRMSGCPVDALHLIQERLDKLLPKHLRNDALVNDAKTFSRSFYVVVQRERRQLGPTEACRARIVDACRQALGSDVIVKQVGSYLQRTGCKLAGSDLDIRVTRPENSGFVPEDKERLRQHLAELPFARNVRVGTLAVKFAIHDVGIDESLLVDVVLLPQPGYEAEKEDYPSLRGSPHRFMNDAAEADFLLRHVPARLAVVALKLLLDQPRLPGLILEAIACRVAVKLGLTPASNETDIESTAIFLEALSELAEPGLAKDDGLRKFASACSIGERGLDEVLQSVSQHILRRDWFRKFMHLLVNPVGFTNNTKIEMTKHPDRHWFYLPGGHLSRQGQYKYKCMWCNDYNKGVGLQDTDRCQQCSNVQVKHPDYERCRREVEEHERANDPYAAGPSRLSGEWLEEKPASNLGRNRRLSARVKERIKRPGY